ncbi:uncharacterized protein LOC130448249 [Diorhabda sublineata]|uniref:uncharacterized protein LOC130448249 n=1 Tax=Diorhabda sublineata TaxID=1163346 RepID=UPI0024E11ED1|nr:uncharacterized protein LOC130448249 [Diorhabda sublineata]
MRYNSGECISLCDEEKLISFLANVQVSSPESILTLSIEELETDICSKLEKDMKTVGKNYEECQTANPQSLYVELITGLQALNDKLCCFETGFYRQYQVYHPCLYELKRDFDSCNGPADWVEEADAAQLCKISKTIVDCYYIKTAKVCGEPAALAIGDLATHLIQSTIGHSCKDIDKFPVVKDAMPASYIERRNYSLINKQQEMQEDETEENLDVENDVEPSHDEALQASNGLINKQRVIL